MRDKAADALDNAAMTSEGLLRGEPVFDRFRRGPAKVRYWREVADAAGRLLGPEPLVSELEAAVAELEVLARDAPRVRRGRAVAAPAIVVASLALGRSGR